MGREFPARRGGKFFPRPAPPPGEDLDTGGLRGVPSGCIFACVHMESAPTAPQLPPRAPEQPFALLADRTRLRLLMLLEEGRARGRELCVGDLVEVLELPQPSVSRHLGRLRRAGWVAARRRDPWVFYSLSPQAAAGHLTRLLELCDRSAFSPDRDRLVARLAEGGCCPP